MLFFDAASLKKTVKSGKIYGVFGMILDLGPILRNKFENLIKVFTIGASKPNLNLFLQNNTTKLIDLLKDGIQINSKDIKIQIIIISIIVNSRYDGNSKNIQL